MAIVIIVIFSLFFIYYIVRFSILGFTGRDVSPFIFLSKFIDKAGYDKKVELHTNILRSLKFQYFLNLDNDRRKKFLKRLSDFLYEKEFVPHEIAEITIEQKVLISASAIQLSFGLDRYMLSNFSKINIFPNKYFSNYSKAYHKGDVNLNGSISLSYEDIIKGYEDASDGVNLAYHEMAHALQFDRFMQEEPNDFFTNYYHRWVKSASTEFEKVKNNENTFLRSYAGTNINEFFAVCIENFFERPQAFKNELPDLYEKISILLNQDPLNKTNPCFSPKNSPLKANFTPNTLIHSSDIGILYLGKLLFRLGFFGFMVVVINMNLYESKILTGVFITSVYVFVLYVVAIKINQYCIFENGLVVRPFFMKPFYNDSFSYKNIVLVNVNYELYNSFTLKFFDKNHIRVKHYNWFGSKKEYIEFFSKLEEKDVIIVP